MRIGYNLLIGVIFLSACGKKPETKPDRNYPKEILEMADRLGLEPSAVSEARALSATALAALTNAYVQEVHQSPSYWRLMPAKDLAIPYLIAVLEREDAFKPLPGSNVLKESPGSRALAFLQSGVHEPLKPVLKKWLETGDKEVLKRIDHQLVSFGSDDLLPAVKLLFESTEPFISSGARSGALEAIKKQRAQPAFKQYVWEHCVELLHGEKPPAAFDPIRLLVAIDPEQAKEIISAPNVMRVDHRLFPEVLSTLNQLKSPPSAEYLTQLLEARLKASDHRDARIRMSALAGLAIHNHPKASEWTEEIIRNQKQYSEDLILFAWSQRFKIHGLTFAHDSAGEAYSKSNFSLAGLSLDQRDFVLMQSINAEVHNGGFEQWYYNESDCPWEETQKALERIGAVEHAKVVASANKLFGLWGPPKEQEKVHKKLESMSESNVEKMNALNEQWFALPSWMLRAYEWDWARQQESGRR